MMTTPSAAIQLRDTIGLMWNSLGVFAWLFLLAVLVIFAFLVRAWVLLGRHQNPLPGSAEAVPAERLEALRLLAHRGMDADGVRAIFFPGRRDSTPNLFYRFLVRFGCRDRALPPPPSLVHAADELYQIGRIQRIANTMRFLSTMLPAVGLLGTLIGMFNAFFGTDFSHGQQLNATMEGLMQNFALALFTTIVAVILKVAVDLFNHFTVEALTSQLRLDLGRLRALLLDFAHEEEPAELLDVPEPAALADVAPASIPSTVPVTVED